MKFRNAHGEYYDYTKVSYERLDQKVTIICPVHGDFFQLPVAHMNGSGCLKCANEKQSSTTQKFIERSKIAHGDRYDYRLTKYINSSTQVTIICSKHGSFNQIPGNHVRGSKCPACAREDITEAQFSLEYRSIRYRSIKHACQVLGKDYWIVLKRLDAGWTLEQAFDDQPHNPRHPLEIDGVVYNGLEDAVRRLNAPVSSKTVRRRLLKGMDLKEALFNPPQLGYDKGIIYLATNLVNGKQYVGLTTTSLEVRWARHLEQVSRKEASFIHKEISEFGEENFILEVIDQADNPKELREKEREWIQKLKTLTPNGYNVTMGGELGGSPGKPTKLPGDSTLYPSVQSAAAALARKNKISQEAAEKRIYTGRIDVNKPHGMSKTRIYKYWDRLVHQVTNPCSNEYSGSAIYDRWKNFQNFYEDVGQEYREGLCLKLINPSLPYSKNNCSWVEKGELHQVHGMVKTPIYRTWSHLVHNLTNPASKSFRGVLICERWRDFTFFLKDMGQDYQDGKILKLLDVSKPYSKENSYWVWTYGEQQSHPLFKTPIYEIWKRLVNEYCNPTSKSYNGSSICDRWQNFALFCEDMASTYQDNFKLVRLNRNRPYCLENCEWKNNRDAAKTHGMTGTKFYNIWARLKHHRTNSNAKAYEGTFLCERWQDFENFKADMYGSYKEGMGLKLFDPHQPYSKENCKWATRSELLKKDCL
ncbi:MAG: GIY-YIG nuclease family protein [Lyngbya sp. HA4199-MV5]|nr:GIY-YIG nuclease family protein [Lyngbya sp. HA4199-MV5]